MKQIHVRRRPAVAACAATVVAVSSLVAGCGNNGKEAPATPSPSSSSVSVSPTEKSLSPNGGNKFTPSVVAPPAPTMAPGDHHYVFVGMG